MNRSEYSMPMGKSVSVKRMAGCLLRIVIALSLIPASVSAATRAWLDRTQVAQGQSVALKIETDQTQAEPDYTPLRQQFKISNPMRRQELTMVNGDVSKRIQFGLSLMPMQTGELTVPALKVGNEYTQPLALTVTDAEQMPLVDRDVFLDMQVDQSRPYVQQNVGVTVRLYYSVPIVSGQLDLPVPEGAALQRVGNDLRSVRVMNGRSYHLVERRFLLVPERSGDLELAAPQFSGRIASRGYDDFFGGGTDELNAAGQPMILQVRPQPDAAVQPWLPLQDLSLRYVSLPKQLRAGEAATVEVAVLAQGATRSQLPSLPEYVIPGAQVFAEPPEYTETFVDGSPHLQMKRRYSVVPSHAGDLSVPRMSIPWWNTVTDKASMAVLPAITLTVAAGDAAEAADSGQIPAAVDTGDADGHSPVAGSSNQVAATSAEPTPWKGLAWAMAGLWLISLGILLYWKYRRQRPPVSSAPEGRVDDADRKRTLADLRSALDTGDLQEVGEVLRHMVSPALADMDALAERLADPSQREAVAQLQRACWGTGADMASARAALRTAFREGPCWFSEPAAGKVRTLPPLYPSRGKNS